jgi:hypothetical protein
MTSCKMKTRKKTLVILLFLLFSCGLRVHAAPPLLVTVSGHVAYKHNANPITGTFTPFVLVDSTIVKLKLNGVVIAQDTVDSLGFYQFNNVAPGYYTYEIECHKMWSGGNATDCITIMRTICGIPPILTGFNLKAAHVANHANISALDALYIARRFLGTINSFPSGDWCFENIGFFITGSSNITQNVFGLCYGDVNGSYIPLGSFWINI